MNNSLVTVVIPTYKRSEYLRQAIASVVKQSYPLLEIVVVDDNSDQSEKDKVKDVVMEFAGRVRLFDNFRTKGACGARNCGIERSSGELIAFLDDDDLWHPLKVAKQVELIEREGGVGALCNYYDVDVSMGKIRECKLSATSYTKTMALLGECPTSTSLVIVRKDVLLKAGLFDEAMPSFQDFDMWLRCLDFGDMSCVHEPLVKFVQHGDDRVSVNVTRRLAGLAKVKEKWAVQMNHDGDWLSFEKRVKADLFIANGRALMGRQYFKSVLYFMRALVASRGGAKASVWLVLGMAGATLGKLIYLVSLHVRGVSDLPKDQSAGGW